MRQGTRNTTWLTEKQNLSEDALVYILTMRDESLLNLKPSMIATALHADRIQLAQDFKKDQNLSLSSFIEREIIYRAVFQLERDQNISISKLAKKLSFRATKDFEITFEKYLLIKPSRYKEMVKMRANHFYQKDLLHCHCSFL